jgi:hypothetical protein
LKRALTASFVKQATNRRILGFSLRTSSYKADFLKIGSYLMAKKVSKRREWTPAKVRTLKALARKKTHAARIAKTLKRTVGATRQKAFSMGLSLDSRA